MQRFVIPQGGEVRRVNSRDGKMSFVVQSCGLVGRDGLTSRFDIWHNDSPTSAKPYQPGMYTLDIERSLYVDRKGNLAIRPVLIPLPESK